MYVYIATFILALIISNLIYRLIQKRRERRMIESITQELDDRIRLFNEKSKLDLSKFDTSKVTDMTGMFKNYEEK